MYHATLRCFRATIVAVYKQWVLHNLSVRICSLRYPAFYAHAPYCHLWPAPIYIIFPHYLINGTIFEKNKVIEHKICVLISSITFIWNISRFKKNEQDMIKKMYLGRHVKYPLFLSDFNETWIFSTNFPTLLKYQMSCKSVRQSRVVPSAWTDAETDRHDEANSRFAQFFKRA
jgi:hypothetical protein